MKDFWYQAPEGEVHRKVMDYVASVESAQFELFNLFVQCAVLYDPHDRQGVRAGWWEYGGHPWGGPDGQVYENVCASNVDTVAAIISPNKPRARFIPDDGDWSDNRRAKELERYTDGLVKLLDVHGVAQRGFKEAAKKGTGLAKVFEDGKRIHVELTPVDEIVVDEGECLSGQMPRQMHQRKIVNKESLKDRFPNFADQIDKAQSGLRWADYRPIEDNECVVIESWLLPYGDQGDDDYRPGRHAITVEGADILDEEYHKPCFPFARMVWSERGSGWYGIGLIERIAGHQRTVNKRNWQIDRQIDQHAVPTTWVQQADAAITVKTINRFGTIGVYKVAKPDTVTPQAVSPETFKHLADTKASAFEESGVSRLAASAMKPAGIDSGVGLREYRDQTTQRFAVQESSYEQFFLDIVCLVVSCAKDLGKNAPVVMRRAQHGKKKIKWANVDMGEVKVMIQASSQLAKTPAGRMQFGAELVERGLMTADEYRSVLLQPDVDGVLSLYTAAYDNVERCIEEILDGEIMVPEPYQNLQMIVWRGTHHYFRAQEEGAPEEILENLRTYITQAAHIQAKALPPTAPVGAAAAPALAPSLPGMGAPA